MDTTKRITRPLARNVVVEVVLPTSSLIIPSDQIKNMNDKDFVVAALGPECTRGLAVGDIVQVADGFRALPCADGRELHFICSETDIEAVIDLVPAGDQDLVIR